MADFLLEIGVEEIPARMIDGAREELARRVGELLHRERLAESPAVEAYSTPRRLAVLAHGVLASQADVTEQLTGPSLKIAYKDGAPTPAAEAFARKAGVDVSALEKVTTPKGEYLAATVRKKGRTALDILSESLPKEIAGLYWAKSMYWRGKSASDSFAPCVGWSRCSTTKSCRLSSPASPLATPARDIAFSPPAPVTIHRPSDYASEPREKFRDRELPPIASTTSAKRSMPPHEPFPARAGAKTSLCSTPSSISPSVLRSFSATSIPSFSTLPQEVLVTVMRDHQKYFAVEDAERKTAAAFSRRPQHRQRSRRPHSPRQ